MKLNDLSVDVGAIDSGMWVDSIPDCGDLEIKTRGLNNPDYVALQGKLTRALPRSKRTDTEETRKITAECVAKTCLQDWRNLTDPVTGAPIPVAQAATLLPQRKYAPLLDAVIYAADYVSKQRAEDKSDAEKN